MLDRASPHAILLSALRWLLAGVLLLGCGNLFALDGHRVLLAPDQPRYDAGLDAQYLEDTNQLLSIEDFIAHPVDFVWRQSQSTTPNFGYSRSAYWLRFEVNNLHDPRLWLIEISYPLLDDVQVYFLSRDKIIHQIQTGDRQEFSTRPFNHRHFVIPFPPNAPADVEVYVRVETTGTLEIPLTIWREDAFWTKEQPILALKGIYAGLVLVMVLYNLFIYLAVKETSYLYYVCYAFFLLMLQVSLDGFAYQMLWPAAISWHELSFLLSIAFTSAFQSLFTHSFLDLEHRLPLASKALLALVLILTLCAAAALTAPYALVIRIVVALVFPISLICWFTGMYLFMRGVAVARYFVLGWTVFFIGALALAASKFGMLPINFLTDNAMQIGSALEVVLFSLALADRINIDRREKLAAKQEAIKHLERFKMLYDNAIEGIFQCTLEGRFVSANPSMAHFMGYPSPQDFIDHVTEKGPQSFMDPVQYHEFRRAVLSKGQILNFEAQGRRKDGKPFWFSLSAKMVQPSAERQRLIEGFVVDITERKRSEEQLHFLARHDPLTGLVNRREFEHRLELALQQTLRDGVHHTLLFMDLDQFKLVNDACGHIAGDELLRQITLHVQQQMRSGDTLARMGGDE
ncbi:MAG TPA: 7TM diverse intracellular signaling domain-containing protein, partial [Dongiaceae bacterium]|nr:7TM diverse intracellular signaling domain-containing protein [Dongiaceae bacterium]